MSEPIMRIAAIFCCMGMGVWPLMQRCGCCCTTALEYADRVIDEQCCERCCPDQTDQQPCHCPLAARSFEAIPNFAIKNFTQDHSLVESVFSSPFQVSLPGDSALWEVVENLRPSRVPRHVMFCTYLE